jgi:aldose 1-epimerase
MSKNYNNLGLTKESFTAEIFNLKNRLGSEICLTNFGATVMSIKMPDKKGNFDDVVLGFDSAEKYQTEDYLKSNTYFGATIGRYANRIANAKFSIGGTEYKLEANNFENTLHSGSKGFDKVFWNANKFTSSVEFTYISKDGEGGFPGNLSAKVVYSLNDNNELQIDYSAATDKETVVCFTHHSYFNLSGKADILSHKLQINADKFMPINEKALSTGEIIPVNGTPFDFRELKEIGKEIASNDHQILNGNGYDHNFVLNGEATSKRLAATVIEEISGRKLEVFTTEPGLHFFSGNSFNQNLIGKQGKSYEPRSGFCLEPQHFPDSPNHPEFPTTILKPNEFYKSQTIYKFSTIN